MSQEVRDAVARLEGWTKARGYSDAWEKGSIRVFAHPIPDDLDACAKAWDEHAGSKGWWWLKSDGSYCHTYYYASDGPVAKVKLAITGHDAASELRDRWELLGLVLKARGVV